MKDKNILVIDDKGDVIKWEYTCDLGKDIS